MDQMSDASKEPEKYSLDEMVSRLKSRGDDEGELVTREDGSQVLKKRRRKRRSNQPAKKGSNESQRAQLIQIVAVTVTVVLIFVLGTVGLVYSNSNAFREDLIKKAELTSGGKVEMKQFRMNPATANSARINMSWPEGNVLQLLEVATAVAKISPASFLGRRFSGDEIVAASGDLILRAPVKGGVVGYGGGNEGKKPISFGRYAIRALNVYFGSSRLSKNMLEKTEASFSLVGDGSKSEIRMVGGQLRYGAWPVLQMDRSYIRMDGSEMDVQSMRFVMPPDTKQKGVERGWIDFTGVLKPLDADDPHVLDVELDEFRLPYILGIDLGRFFEGRVMTDEDARESNWFKFHPDLIEEAEMELSLTHSLDSQIEISQLDFLVHLASRMNDRWYELPQFENDISMVVKRSEGFVEVKDLRMEQRGRIAIRGGLTSSEGGMITGRLSVGIPGNLINAAKDKRLERIFGEVREGYRWVDVEIGGTGASPSDNFKQLYDAANEDGKLSGLKAEANEEEKGEEAEEEKKKEEEVDDFDKLIGED